MRHLFCVVLIIVCNLAVFAQDAPKTEIFAGYSYGNYELLPGSSSVVVDTTTVSGAPSGRLGLNGWNGSVAVNMKRWFSFMTDFSGYYSGSSASTTVTETFSPCASCGTQTTTIVNVASNPRIHNFLFGPQFSYPSGKVRPFALLHQAQSGVAPSGGLPDKPGWSGSKPFAHFYGAGLAAGRLTRLNSYGADLRTTVFRSSPAMMR